MKFNLLFFLSLVSLQVFSQKNEEKIVFVEGLGQIVLSDNHTWSIKKDNRVDTHNDIDIFDCDSILLKKYTDNKGLGNSELTGARNMRTVLKGVLYRGGANNKLNPMTRRDNNNPLNVEALLELQALGFSDVVYLYNKNFDIYYPNGLRSELADHGINYESIVPSNDSLMKILLEKMFVKITIEDKGMIYMHCWNGWHMSGLAAAYALMQFCDFSKSAAWEYWKKGTDGNYKGFDKIKSRIYKFEKIPDFEISYSDKQKICPCSK